ncbi:hypothetical protein ACFL6H_00795 [Candidatus Latescibacterota bacterium]
MFFITRMTVLLMSFCFGFYVPIVYSQQSTVNIKDVYNENDYKKLLNTYEQRISDLENKIRELESEKAKEERASELDALLNEIDTLKEQERSEDLSINRVFRSDARQQQQLNPEISFTGDFSGSYSSGNSGFFNDIGDFSFGRNKFYFREAEFNVVAPLDPFTRGKFFFGIPGTGGAAISTIVEEAYMEWLNLPGGMNLKIGEFNTQFGILNRWHDHGLYQYDRPRALTNLFGTGNFGGTGVSGNFLLPKLWAHVNELDIEIVSGGDGFSFDDSYENIIGIAHLKNYYDITGNTYIEFGVSGAYGHNNIQNNYMATLAGIDFTYKWVPAGRSRYRTTEFKSEFFFSSRDAATGTSDGFGFYSFIINKIGPRTWIGLRYSYSDMPPDPNAVNYSVLKDADEWDISPTFDFWQSEFVMLRFQYSYVQRSYAENDNTFFLQTVWSMGPHKHEKY